MISTETDLRESIIQACLRMSRERLVTGTAGNISVRVGDRMLITPSSVDYELMTPDDIHNVSIDVTAEFPDRASSETPLHRIVYATSAAQAVVHYHGLHSVAVSNICTSMPVEHYYAMRIGGEVSVAPYARFGSSELAENVGGALEGRLAALMQNHGGVSIGRDLDHAYANASLLEWLCQLNLTTRSAGTPRSLTSQEIADVSFMYERNRLD